MRKPTIVMTRFRALEILGIADGGPALTMDDVKRARKTKMFEVHPDRNPSLSMEVSAGRVQEVSDAYAYFVEHGASSPAHRPHSSSFADMGEDFHRVMDHIFRGGGGPGSGRHAGGGSPDIEDPIGDALRFIFENNRRARATQSAARRSGPTAPSTSRVEYEPPEADPIFIRPGRHVLRFDRVNRYRAGARYHFTVVRSTSSPEHQPHKAGERVVWREQGGFHPTRVWESGETIIASIARPGAMGKDQLFTAEQLREQIRVEETLFRVGRDAGMRGEKPTIIFDDVNYEPVHGEGLED